jgi:hypothetical protein
LSNSSVTLRPLWHMELSISTKNLLGELSREFAPFC